MTRTGSGSPAIERYLDELGAALRPLYREREIERILEEVGAHLQAAVAEELTKGPADRDEEAARRVVAGFGSPAQVAAAYRRSSIASLDDGTDDSPFPDLTTTINTRPRLRPMDMINFRHIARSLISKPSFTLVTIATLALGIGANAVILSVVNGVLLQPLPFPDADRLVRVYHTAPGLNIGIDDIGLSTATYFFFRDSGVLEDLAIYQSGAGNLSGGEEPQRVGSVSVSRSFFETLGVAPLLGRAFNADDEMPDASPVIILAEGLWRSNFGARPDAVGETVLLDGQTAEVVGVMPAGLTFPNRDAGLYEPMTLDPAQADLGSLGINSVARLPAGMAPDEAAAQLGARIVDLTEVFPDQDAAPILQQAGLTANVIDLREQLVGDVQRTLWVLMGSVGFILLIACANVANVFLVRAEGREREMAIRSALGAGRGRLALGFLGESAVLGLLAGVLGLVIAYGGVRGLVYWGPQQLPRIDEIGIDATVVAATFLLALATGVLFGIIPVLRYNTAWLGAAIKEGGRANTGGRGRLRLRGVLVATQVALAVVLLVGCGLMVRSFRSLSSVDPGFDPESLLTFQLALNRNDYAGEIAPAAFIQRAVDVIAEMPGVVSAASTSSLPLGGSAPGRGMLIEDHPLASPDSLPAVHFYEYVSPGYFETMGIPLVDGRAIERADAEERRASVVVNEAFARLYWPDGSAIGKRIQPGGGSDPDPETWYTIVGVVGDVRMRTLEQPPIPQIYFPLVSILRVDEAGNRTSPSWGDQVRIPQFAVRTSGNPTALAQPIRQRIQELDPNLPIARVQAMQEYVEQSMAQKSFTMVLLLVGAIGALLIGAVGIYGVVSYLVAQQTREIGVRMALGARAADIGRMVVGRSLLVCAAGTVVGVAGAAFLTRSIQALLFGVDPLDPLTFAAVVATLLGVAALAAWLPARRAARIDPLEALRHQ